MHSVDREALKVEGICYVIRQNSVLLCLTLNRRILTLAWPLLHQNKPSLSWTCCAFSPNTNSSSLFYSTLETHKIFAAQQKIDSASNTWQNTLQFDQKKDCVTTSVSRRENKNDFEISLSLIRCMFSNCASEAARMESILSWFTQTREKGKLLERWFTFYHWATNSAARSARFTFHFKGYLRPNLQKKIKKERSWKKLACCCPCFGWRGATAGRGWKSGYECVTVRISRGEEYTALLGDTYTPCLSFTPCLSSSPTPPPPRRQREREGEAKLQYTLSAPLISTGKSKFSLH